MESKRRLYRQGRQKFSGLFLEILDLRILERLHDVVKAASERGQVKIYLPSKYPSRYGGSTKY